MVNEVFNIIYFHISGIWGRERDQTLGNFLINLHSLLTIPWTLRTIFRLEKSSEITESRNNLTTDLSWVVEGSRPQPLPCTTPAGQLTPAWNWNYSAAEAVSADVSLVFRMKADSYSFGPTLAHGCTCVLCWVCLPSLSPALALFLLHRLLKAIGPESYPVPKIWQISRQKFRCQSKEEKKEPRGTKKSIVTKAKAALPQSSGYKKRARVDVFTPADKHQRPNTSTNFCRGWFTVPHALSG